jgi:hypothetical protein
MINKKIFKTIEFQLFITALLFFLIGFFYPYKQNNIQPILDANKTILDSNNEELDLLKEHILDLEDVLLIKNSEIKYLEEQIKKRDIILKQEKRKVMNLNQIEAQKWNDSVGKILVKKYN